jgi:hypothetical protein
VTLQLARTDEETADEGANGSAGKRIDPAAPWPYHAGLPQRYGQNYARYLARGGLVRPEEDVRGFVATQDGNRGDMARFYFFCLVLDQLVKEGIKGDLAELGVYKGSTATLIAQIARRLGTTAYLLDTFEGFDAADFKGVDARQKVHFDDTSLERVRALVGDESARYVKGHFPGSASQIPGDAKFCLVHIDCDLYAPMHSALEYFYPRLLPGGFLIMHDYSSLYWNGAERAVDEFFSGRVESPVPLTDGAGSVVVRKVGKVDRFNNWLVRRRAAVLARDWVSAADNGLGELLGVGWGVPEKWGVWGIGPVHELYLYLPCLPTKDIELEADVHAALIGRRASQEVEVWVGGALLAVWVFIRGENRGLRRVRIPNSLAAEATAMQNLPGIKVEFRPRDIAAPNELDPTNADTRPLGLGVSRLRLQPLRDQPI